MCVYLFDTRVGAFRGISQWN